MKTKILLFVSAILMAMNLQAQAPEKFNYQGVARDNTGTPLANQSLGIKISILHNTTVDYSETHTVATNDFGLYALIIGDGAPVFGGMASVDWESGNKFIKVEIDPNGGTNYTDLGTTELLSVPYALYAASAPGGSGGGAPTGPAGGDLTGNYPNPSIANNAVTSGNIDNGTIVNADLANNAVTAQKIDDMGASTGEVLKWNGTTWAPSTDVAGTGGGSYTAGAGIAISGTNEISADLGTDIATAEIQNNAVTSGKIANGAVATADLANHAVTAAKIDPMGATSGQVLKFDGTDWAPAADIEGTAGTTYSAGTGIAISGTDEISADLGTDVESTEIVDGTIATSDLADDAVTYSKIDATSATTGQVLKFNGTNWAPASDDPGAAGWELGGNAATATDFIGTTNNQDLRFKVNGYDAGFISSDGSVANTSFGLRALSQNTTGLYNTAMGHVSLDDNTTGIGNVAYGYATMQANTSGGSNTAIGQSSLFDNLTGSGNTGIGNRTLAGNTTGDWNTASGREALYSNISGNYNTALGSDADVSIGSLTNATAIGARALVAQDNSLILGSINGVNGATASTKVGIGTTTPETQLHMVYSSDNLASKKGFTLENSDDTTPGKTGVNMRIGGSTGSLYLYKSVANTLLGYFDGVTGAYNPLVGGTSWNTEGNDATIADFIGTTNTASLKFKVNNIEAGIITDEGPYTTAFGQYALSANMNDGLRNTGIGFQALNANTTGDRNVGIGHSALKLSTTGSDNTAIGAFSMDSNTTGGDNVAIGNYALSANTTGSRNTAVGNEALWFSTGSDNSAFGSSTMAANTTGNQNAAFGVNTMLVNLTGNGGSAFGYNVLSSNTSGDYNSAFGMETLKSNTSGNYNSAFGYNALIANTTGTSNVAMGNQALAENTTSDRNTAIGYQSMKAYSGIGYENTAIGSDTEISDGVGNSTALGGEATVTTSNHIVLGDAFVSNIGGYAPWSNLSDIRFKKDVEPAKHGLDFIMKLKPITYHINSEKLHSFINSVREDDIEMTKRLRERMSKKSGQLLSGFSAQQVEAAAQSIGYEFSGVNAPENQNSHYTVSYSTFVVPMVKAIQEQQKTIEALQEANDAQQAIIVKMQERLAALEQK